MKGCSGWSYAPYKPFLYDTGDIYICRVVPYEDKIHFEWLSEEDEEYTAFYRKRDDGEFVLAGKTRKNEFDITGLTTDTDYEFYVTAGEKKSRVRLARAGKAVGTVVNYLHPDDTAYSFSGRFLCSPSLVRHPDGFLLASMDLFDFGTPQNLTLIFRSDDDGETWHYVSELMPCFWGKMFIHKNELYMLSVSTEYGDLLLGKSTDGGKTFGAPVALLRGSGRIVAPGVHKNPQNVMVYGGRIYCAFEWGTCSRAQGFYHAASVMSCGIDDDLLVPENWHFAPPLKYDPSWPGTAKGNTGECMEGTLCVNPQGELYNVMRYGISGAEPAYGLVLAYKVNTSDPDAPLEYSHAIKLDCNNSKFTIKRDSVTGRYFTIGDRIDCYERRNGRNLLSLYTSDDMENWRVVCDLLDRRDGDMEKIGFQYCDFEMEGEDIIFLCRTAINNADNFHNSNYCTFHRIKNFRNL